MSWAELPEREPKPPKERHMDFRWGFFAGLPVGMVLMYIIEEVSK